MSSVTKFLPSHTQPGTRTLPEILADEQFAFAQRQRLGMIKNNNLVPEEVLAASDEDREGASLLRKMIDRSHVVAWDDEAVLLRVFVSTREFEQLELWGSDNCDREPGHDLEQAV